MGQFNTNAPDVLGMEPRWQEDHTLRLTNGVGALQRLRPGAKTYTRLHLYEAAAHGSRPGLAAEVLSGEPLPAVAPAVLFPGADVTVAKWENQAAGTTNLFNVVDDYADTTDYARNDGAVLPGERRPFVVRGTNAALSSVRVPLVAVTMQAKMAQFKNTHFARVRGLLKIGGQSYYGNDHLWPNDANWYLPPVLNGAAWTLNPATGLPWTLAAVNNIVATGSTDGFGFDLAVSPDAYNQIDDNAFQVASLAVWVLTVAENRAGSQGIYVQRKLREGWDSYPFPANFTTSNNAYYWLLQWALSSNPGDDLIVPRLADEHGTFALADDATDLTGEQRDVLAAAVTVGIPTATIPTRTRPVTDGIKGNSIPFLLEAQRATSADGVTTNASPAITSASAAFSVEDVGSPIAGTNVPAGTTVLSVQSATAATMSANASASGTLIVFTINSISSASQPYCEIDRVDLHKSSAANIGQKLTPAGNKDYAAVVLTVGWGSFTMPDRPLDVKVNSAIDGTGTTFATFTLKADRTDTWVKDRLLTLSATVSGVAGTPLYVLVSSQAQTDRPWRILRYDTRSDNIKVGAGTTLSQVEGASLSNGLAVNTHAYVEAGAALTRYDLAAALVAAPDPPPTFVVTPKAAL